MNNMDSQLDATMMLLAGNIVGALYHKL